jgi:hypothetical protein
VLIEGVEDDLTLNDRHLSYSRERPITIPVQSPRFLLYIAPTAEKSIVKMEHTFIRPVIFFPLNAKDNLTGSSRTGLLDVSLFILTVLRDAARASPVPYIQEAATVALGIVSIVQVRVSFGNFTVVLGLHGLFRKSRTRERA